MGRGSLPVVAWWTSQPPSPGHACRWLCCQRYTRVPYWCSCKPQQWKKQINNDRNFSWRRPTGQSVKILESGSRHQCSSPYLGGNHLLPSPKVSGWWAQDLVLKERGRTGPVCCMALKYRAVKLDPLHAWPVTQTACMKWLKLISMLTNNERPWFFFPSWSEVRQKKPFLHMLKVKKCWCFRNFHWFLHDWKCLERTVAIRNWSNIPGTPVNFQIWYFSLFQSLSHDWQRQGAVERLAATQSWYIHQTSLCVLKVFFPSMLILNPLDFLCCSQAEGRITGGCLVQPNIVDSIRFQPDLMLIQLLHSSVSISLWLEMLGKHCYYGECKSDFWYFNWPPDPLLSHFHSLGHNCQIQRVDWGCPLEQLNALHDCTQSNTRPLSCFCFLGGEACSS